MMSRVIQVQEEDGRVQLVTPPRNEDSSTLDSNDSTVPLSDCCNLWLARDASQLRLVQPADRWTQTTLLPGLLDRLTEVQQGHATNVCVEQRLNYVTHEVTFEQQTIRIVPVPIQDVPREILHAGNTTPPLPAVRLGTRDDWLFRVVGDRMLTGCSSIRTLQPPSDPRSLRPVDRGRVPCAVCRGRW